MRQNLPHRDVQVLMLMKNEVRDSRIYHALLTRYVGGCQNYGHFLGPCYDTGPNTGPNLGDPKRDHNFDNPPCYVNFRTLNLLKP